MFTKIKAVGAWGLISSMLVVMAQMAGATGYSVTNGGNQDFGLGGGNSTMFTISSAYQAYWPYSNGKFNLSSDTGLLGVWNGSTIDFPKLLNTTSYQLALVFINTSCPSCAAYTVNTFSAKCTEGCSSMTTCHVGVLDTPVYSSLYLSNRITFPAGTFDISAPSQRMKYYPDNNTCTDSPNARTIIYGEKPNTAPTVNSMEVNAGAANVYGNSSNQTNVKVAFSVSDAETAPSSLTCTLSTNGGGATNVGCLSPVSYNIPAGIGSKNLTLTVSDGSLSGSQSKSITVVDSTAGYVDLGLPACSSLAGAGYTATMSNIQVYSPSAVTFEITPNATFTSLIATHPSMNTFRFAYHHQNDAYPVDFNSWQTVSGTLVSGKYVFTINSFPTRPYTLKDTSNVDSSTIIPDTIYIINEGLRADTSIGSNMPCGMAPVNTSNLITKIDNTQPQINIPTPPKNMSWKNIDIPSFNITCTDTESGCSEMKYALTDLENCDDTSVTYSTCSSLDSCVVPAETDHKNLCIKGRDISGNNVFPTNKTEIKIDKTTPTVTSIILKDSFGRILSQKSGVYYSNDTTLTATVSASDSLSGFASGLCTFGGVVFGCTGDVNKTGLTIGTNIVSLKIKDLAGNTLPDIQKTVIVENITPTLSKSMTLVKDETSRKITLSLPIATDDNGIDYFEIVAKHGSDKEMLANSNLINVSTNLFTQNGSVIILPTGGTTPTEIVIKDMKVKDIIGSQYNYDITLNVYDLAGNVKSQTISGLKFDTLAPIVQTEQLFADGSISSPYRVGADSVLQFTVTATEKSNSSDGSSQVPLTLSDLSFDTGTYPFEVKEMCDGMAKDTSCSIAAKVPGIPDTSAAKEATFKLYDTAGNEKLLSFFIRKNTSKPKTTGSFAIQTSFDGVHMNTNQIKVTLKGIDEQDNEGLRVIVKYTASDGSKIQIVEKATNIGGEYSFSETLNNLIYGSSNLTFEITDLYGNSLVDSVGSSVAVSALEKTIFFDNKAPDISAGYRTSFIDNKVTISFDAIADDSFPVQIIAKRIKKDGSEENLAPSVAQIESINKGDKQDIIIPADIATTKTVIVQFKDSVKTLSSSDTIIDSSNILQKSFGGDFEVSIVRGVGLSNESLELSYALPAGSLVSAYKDIQSIVDGPYGRNESVPMIPKAIITSTGLIGKITNPLKGMYSIKTVLTKADGSISELFSSYTLDEDIVSPNAEILGFAGDSATKVVKLPTENTYVISTTKPSVGLQYVLHPEFENSAKTIYDENLPIKLRVVGMTTNPLEKELVAVDDTGTGDKTGTFDIPFVTEKEYNTTINFIDNIGNTKSAIVKIIKDNSKPNAVFDVTQNSLPIIVQSIAAKEPSGQTAYVTADLTNINIVTTIDNESLPVITEISMKKFGTTDVISGSATESTTSGIQKITYTLPTLEKDTLYQITLKVKDIVGNETGKDMFIRTDLTAPTITGKIDFANESRLSPTPLIGTVDDFSTIMYTLSEDGLTIKTGEVIGNSVTIPDGTYAKLAITFTDAVGNRTALQNIDHFVHIDSTKPTIKDPFWTPTQAYTTGTGLTLKATLSDTDSQKLNYEVRQDGIPLSTGSVLKAGYTAPIDFNLVELIPNRIQTISLVVTDELGNTESISRLIAHDLLAPFVSDITYEVNTTSDRTTWTFVVTDSLKTPLKVPFVTIINSTTGEKFPATTTEKINGTGTGTYLSSSDFAVKPGHKYQLSTTVSDVLDNAQTLTSTGYVLKEQSYVDNLNPLLNGPSIVALPISGSTIKVSALLGGNIICDKVTLTRGEKIIIENLAKACGKEKLPIGSYIFRIFDGTKSYDIAYSITPYWFDEKGDINGDGIFGGISDSKLLQIEKRKNPAGFVATYASLKDVLTKIESLIKNNISSNYVSFIKETL